jgi:negative regulator of flagellin synthesis FlgM
MKIDNSTKTVASVQGPAGTHTHGPRPAATGVKSSPSAGQSATVVSAGLHAVAATEAAFDAQKVAEIRLAISEGRFHINPERVADGLINSVREMLGQNRSSS